MMQVGRYGKVAAKKRLFSLFGVAVMLLFIASAATFAAEGDEGRGIDPEAFDVRMDIEPPSSDEPEQPNCEQRQDGNYCTITHNFDASGTARGTVDYRGRDPLLSGDMAMDYDMWNNHTTVVRIDPNGGPDQQPTFISVNGSGEMSGTWCMDYRNDPLFEGGSKLCGEINGRFTEELISGTTTVKWTGEFRVHAIGISGEFEGVNGSGGWTETSQFDMSDRRGPGSDDGGSREGAHAASISAAGASSGMKLKLVRSKQLKAYVGLPNKLNKKDKRSAVVAAKPGSKCTLEAKNGAGSKSFGRDKADSDARAEFKGSVVKKLGKGKWSLKATCKLNGKKAVARQKLSIG